MNRMLREGLRCEVRMVSTVFSITHSDSDSDYFVLSHLFVGPTIDPSNKRCLEPPPRVTVDEKLRIG
jgi:hypothetical protein